MLTHKHYIYIYNVYNTRELLSCTEKLAAEAGGEAGGEEAGRAAGLLQDMMPLLLRCVDR
jgi:hypothetical protein